MRRSTLIILSIVSLLTLYQLSGFTGEAVGKTMRLSEKAVDFEFFKSDEIMEKNLNLK